MFVVESKLSGMHQVLVRSFANQFMRKPRICHHRLAMRLEIPQMSKDTREGNSFTEAGLPEKVASPPVVHNQRRGRLLWGAVSECGPALIAINTLFDPMCVRT